MSISDWLRPEKDPTTNLPPGLDAAGLLQFAFDDLERENWIGKRTVDIESRLIRLLTRSQVKFYFKGYRGYPNIVSTSVNAEIAYAPTSTRLLKEGDLLKVEFGLFHKGEYAFMAKTCPLGTISPKNAMMLLGCKSALNKGISAVLHGSSVGDISWAIHQELRMYNLVPNEQFGGYRTGPELRMDPFIPCFATKPGPRGFRLSKGMKLAVLVIAHPSTPEVRIKADGWTAFDAKGAPSAYFGSLIEVTEGQPKVLCG